MPVTPTDRDSLLEQAVEERLRTHNQLLTLCEIMSYPDSLETLGKAQKRGLLLIRAYQDVTRPEAYQGARQDKVRELVAVTVELRFLMINRADCGTARGFAKDALAGYTPSIAHLRYIPSSPFRAVQGGLVGRVRGSKRWDYYDAYEVDLIYETRPGSY